MPLAGLTTTVRTGGLGRNVEVLERCLLVCTATSVSTTFRVEETHYDITSLQDAEARLGITATNNGKLHRQIGQFYEIVWVGTPLTILGIKGATTHSNALSTACLLYTSDAADE